MKKILFTLALVLSAIRVTAQEHLSFMGIPITGSMTEFCEKLKAKGFTLMDMDRENNYSFFSGNFTGRHATILVHSLDDGADVESLMVSFNPSEEWKTLATAYDYYKDLYTSKYGEPTNSREYNPARTDSNTALMAEVHQGTVDYFSFWLVTGGAIRLTLRKSSTGNIYEGQVSIFYQNTENAATERQKYLEDI